MKAPALHGVRHLRLDRVADPEIRTPGDVIVRVEVVYEVVAVMIERGGSRKEPEENCGLPAG